MNIQKYIRGGKSWIIILLFWSLIVLTHASINHASSKHNSDQRSSASESLAMRKIVSSDQHPNNLDKTSQTNRDGGEDFRIRQKAVQSENPCQTSSIAAPNGSDTLFVADCKDDGDLDTTCRTGQLKISLKIPRVFTFGQRQLLKSNNLLSKTATLTLPAYDVDSSRASACDCENSVEPEYDLIKFNNREVKNGNGTPYLEGECKAWRLNTFEIPIDLINFAADPGLNGTATPAENIITIDVDVKNTTKCWCTSIDWVSLEIFTPVRPLVLVHGINSTGATWAGSAAEYPGAINFIEQFMQRGFQVRAITIDRSDSLFPNLGSIQDNAQVVADEVEASRLRWGANKVNLICHSKGGLDSREFVEFNDGVDKLIQLGTPNAGSPLADLIQEIMLAVDVLGGLAGDLVGEIYENFSGPAAYQLTTLYMKWYNYTHGYNPDVSYYSIAGDYRPGCSFDDLENCSGNQYLYGALMGITGRGDTIVPLTSVHALSQATHNMYSSQMTNYQAVHDKMTKSPLAFSIVYNYLIGESYPAARIGSMKISDESNLKIEAQSPFRVNYFNQQTSFSHTAGLAGTIRQGQKQIQKVPVNESKPTTFILFYKDGNLDLTLISPSGQRFDSSTPNSNKQVGFGETQVLNGILEAYSINSPEIGLWQVEVSAPSVISSSGRSGYLVSSVIDGSGIKLVGEIETPNVKLGEPLKLQATPMLNGTPIRGATVRAVIAMPDNSFQEVALYDDGKAIDSLANDGKYSATFIDTTIPGNYRLAYKAGGNISNTILEFSREVGALATVSRSSSTFTDYYRDFVNDVDSDKFYDDLSIEVGVNITDEAVYRIAGILVDSRGNYIKATERKELTEGEHKLLLKFDGRTLFNNKVNGPYKLAELILTEEDNELILPVDSKTNAYETAFYEAGKFEHEPITLTGKGYSAGIDNNNNNRYDILRVSVEVDIPEDGSYTRSARLTDSSGKELGYVTKTENLTRGLNNIVFDFDGNRIGVSRINGPYQLRGMIIFSSQYSAAVENVYNTQQFLASQFEGYVPDNPVPIINFITPEAGNIDGLQVVMAVTGKNFVKGSKVLWNGNPRLTQIETDSRLWATITAADLSSIGSALVTVSNPAPGGGISNAVTYRINSRQIPENEMEPNELPSQATQFSIPGVIKGQATDGDSYYLTAIYPNGHIDGFEDLYLMTLDKPTYLDFNLKAETLLSDLDLFLLKENSGNYSVIDFSVNSAGMNDRIPARTSLSAGRYLIAVSAALGSSGYTLTVRPPDSTLFSVPFDGSLTAVSGEAPFSPFRAVYSIGIASPALTLVTQSSLSYKKANILNPIDGAIELWIKPYWNGNDNNNHQILRFGDSGGIHITKDNANALRLTLNRYGAKGGAEISVNTDVSGWKSGDWHHLVFTWSNSKKVIEIYVDSQIKARHSFNQTLPDILSDELFLGGDRQSGYLYSVIDELNVYNKVLSEKEVINRYSNP